MKYETFNVSEFFNTDFKEFSNADNVRSIPALVDGFKDSQRKAIYGMTKRTNSEIKVSQAAEHCSSVTHYEHGSTSLADTIVLLAQNFTGSNNVNLLEPIGQFGSILGAEASATRYIYTKLSDNFRKFFKEEDDLILEHRYEDGDKVEPFFYVPILPMWIVNGALGIGTGHSVKILSRSPEKVLKAIKLIVENGSLTESQIDKYLTPHFNGWTGEVVKIEDNSWEMRGRFKKENSTTLRIEELPIGYDVKKFKGILIDLLEEGMIKDFDNLSTENGFNFVVTTTREFANKPADKIHATFKLSSRVTENVTLWDTNGELKKFPSVYEALLEFVNFRLEMYEKRRKALISKLNERNHYLQNRKRFILNWNSLTDPGKMNKEQIRSSMLNAGVEDEFISGFMGLRISSLTLDEINSLNEEIKTNGLEVDELTNTNPKSMYMKEI